MGDEQVRFKQIAVTTLTFPNAPSQLMLFGLTEEAVVHQFHVGAQERARMPLPMKARSE